VWITVVDVGFVNKSTGIGHISIYYLVHSRHLLTGILSCFGCVDAISVNGRKYIQTISQAGLIIIRAVAGGSVNAPCTGFNSHIVGENQ
jgi:hypothetical protein